jgi:mono/diheme cytochrome c family protein
MRTGSAHRRTIVATSLALLTWWPALAQDSASPDRRGEALLAKNCARCHAVGRSGASPHPEAPPFRTLSRKYAVEGLAEALAEGISVGHPDMPEFVFEADEVGAIIAYLRSIQDR